MTSLKSSLSQKYHLQCDKSFQALKNRWSNIQRDVSKFVSYFAKVEELDSSGKIFEDKVNNAKLLFKEAEGKYFKFEECWFVLRQYDKWGVPKKHNNKKRASSDHLSDNLITSYVLESDTKQESVIGTKKAKAQLLEYCKTLEKIFWHFKDSLDQLFI
jgi:hypothetical protein